MKRRPPTKTQERLDLIERITALAERRDLSMKQIGQMVGVSRCCVAGILHRVRQERPDLVFLTGRFESPKLLKKARRLPCGMAPSRVVLVWPKLPAWRIRAARDRAVPKGCATPPAEGKPIWDVGAGECRWIRDDGLCCSGDTGDRAQTFCQTHAAMVYKRTPSSDAGLLPKVA